MNRVDDLFPASGEDIIRYQNDREIVHKTALQLIKDFDRFGIEIRFPVDLGMAYNDLFDQLTPVIQEMLNINHSTLYSLLYAIDLNEQTIIRGAGEMTDLEMHEVIAHLLLERELKKVITREYFSRNK